MMRYSRRLVHVGDRYFRLAVIGRAENVGHQKRWLCRCDCGTIKVIPASSLLSGRTKACGCLRRERMRAGLTRTHGMSGSPTYNSWESMRGRCKNDPSYVSKNIKVCERWESFANFLEDMGVAPPNTSIDRYPDNNGNYEPGNCRWATDLEQASNTRTAVHLTFNNKTQCLSEWARELGLTSPNGITRRLRRGWPLERVLTERSNKDQGIAKSPWCD